MRDDGMALRSLEDLPDTVARLVPAMDGRLIDEAPDPLHAIHATDCKASQLRQLLQHCERSVPEAGRQYCKLRCWGQLIWQPVYLCAVAVYQGHALPSLDHVYLMMRDGLVSGYAIRRHTPPCDAQDHAIPRACSQLRHMCAHFRHVLADIVRINPHASACMQADCILQALLESRERDPPPSHGCMHRRAAQWLQLSGLEKRSSYFEFSKEGMPAIAVCRQTCCQHFRCNGARHCLACPAFSINERIIRLTAATD